ncbi:PAS domain-containing protein [Henriciella aquimarina]|uniref:PAS domain-containing protein n=1 Tax=Henriciella aquimarina TaxID=545261 RepID=UPI001F2E95EB|nr:PAS domain-containing protein [Henriciella aquimarina]
MSAFGFKREELVGRPLYEVFAAKEGQPGAETIAALKRSVARAERMRATDIMPIQYIPVDIAPTDEEGEPRPYWSPRNKPVFGKDNRLSYIIHRTEDVTDAINRAGRNESSFSPEDLMNEPRLAPAVQQSEDLKISNLRLEEQRANLRTAQRLLGLWIWRLNLETMELKWISNPKAELDIRTRDFPGSFRDYLALIHPDDRQPLLDSFEEYQRNRTRMFEFTHRLVLPNKTIAWLSGVGEITYNTSGRILTGVARNVTEDMEKTSQLNLLNESVARLNDIVVITKADDIDSPHGPKIVFVNEAFVKRTGYSREFAIGQTPRILQGPMSSRAELDRIRQALENGEQVRTELINHDKMGAPFWVEIDIVPVSNDGQKNTHYISVMRDISKRKKIAAEREMAENRFRLITQATKDVIWDRSLPDDQIWWNHNYAWAFGYSTEGTSASYESWVSRIHEADRDRILSSLEQFRASTLTFWSEDYRFIRADGEIRWISERVTAVRDKDGAPVRMLGTMEDFTERRELEERVRLSERLESLGQLTGGIAHDFNNLLTVILGNSESLAKRLPSGPLKDMADLSLAACESAEELVSRLLSFARRQPLDPDYVEVNERLTHASKLLRRTLPESINLDFSLSPETGIVLVDLTQFDTAILNLCLNARDAMPKGGTILIESRSVFMDHKMADHVEGLSPGRYVQVSISDTGAGMDSRTAEKAFEPFFTTKVAGAGSGLGLSMVYGFAKQSGGHATIYSEPGTGTRVSLYFPQADTDEVGLINHDSSQGSSLPDLKVLVVEDNEFVMAHVERLMAELGLQILTATNANLALELLRKQPDISLLFTDIVLPGGMNGDELAREARKMLPNLHVIYTTGYTQNAIAHQGDISDDSVLLTKPYRRDELHEKILKALNIKPEDA